MKLLRLAFTLSALVFSACRDTEVPGGQISIRNDILDKDFNSIVIDELRNNNGALPWHKTLNPGEEISLPFKHIYSFRLNRRYADHSKIYFVSCPRDSNQKVLMKLIDIHLNRIDGGCKLSKYGIKRNGVVEWKDKT